MYVLPQGDYEIRPENRTSNERKVAFSSSFLKDHIREITHWCVNGQPVDFLIASETSNSYCLELGATHLQQGHALVLLCTEPAEEIPQTGTHTHAFMSHPETNSSVPTSTSDSNLLKNEAS